MDTGVVLEYCTKSWSTRDEPKVARTETRRRGGVAETCGVVPSPLQGSPMGGKYNQTLGDSNRASTDGSSEMTSWQARALALDHHEPSGRRSPRNHSSK